MRRFSLWLPLGTFLAAGILMDFLIHTLNEK